MSKKLSRFQERLALVLGGGGLVALGIRQKRPAWGGVALAALGAVLVAEGLGWVHSNATFEGRQQRRGATFPIADQDVVDESSEESFPASDAPAW